MKSAPLSAPDDPDASSRPGEPPGSRHTLLPDDIVEQAITWYVRSASGTMTSLEHQKLDQWRTAHPDHARAWERLQNMGGRLQGSMTVVTPAVTHATMARLAAFSSRRQAIKTLLWVGAGSAGVYLAQERVPWHRQFAAMTADIHTSTGHRRGLVLEEGTHLQLNTATAVDLRFDANERRIILLDGEIMIATGSDPAGRPFIVETPEGTLIPLGTRFTVRYDDHASRDHRAARLAVTEGAVQIHARDLANDKPALVHAAQQTCFTRARIDPPTALDETSQAWIDGVFVAESTRLAEFLVELNRYRHGKLSCTAEVANLRITGAWPLDGPDATERILDTLERRLPVKVKRYTRLWVKVAAR